MEALYTTHDVSQLLQVDPSTVSKWVDRGLLQAFKTPGGHRRIRAGTLKAFVKSHGMPIPAELGGEAFKILLVDTHKTTADSVRRILKAQETPVELFHRTSGVQALLDLDTLSPSALFWDAGVPDADIVEVFRNLAQREKNPALKLCALLTRRAPNLEQKLKKAGATSIWAKPLEAPLLTSLIRHGRT
jgi:excisionase family DNA binding protein